MLAVAKPSQASKVRTPISTRPGIGVSKSFQSSAVSPKITQREITSPGGNVTPSLNGSSRVSPSISKHATPLQSARIATSCQPDTPKVNTPKVPLLRLRTSVSPSVSMDGQRQPSYKYAVGVVKSQKPSVSINSKQRESSIFNKPNTPRAPSANGYSAHHIHSDPFAGTRQADAPRSTLKTLVPRPADGLETPTSTGRKASQTQKTNPICQDDVHSIARAKSPSSGRAFGGCAPSRMPQSPTEWTGTIESKVHTGIRCSSAPASSRVRDDFDAPKRGISIKNNSRAPSLKGVWGSESKPVNMAPLRAPYAQNTPRPSSSVPTSRKSSVAPFATTATTTPTAASTRQQIATRAPYHTSTPRGTHTTRTPHYTQAPFHTTTPRGATPSSHAPIKRILH